MLRHLTIITVALAMASLAGCQGRISKAPPVHPNLNMDFQWRFDPQEESEFFADKAAMRPQIEGTVAHGAVEATDAAEEHKREGRIDGLWTDEMPQGMALNEAMLNRGKERFGIYCTPCHGATGVGNGVVVKRGYAQPQSFLTERLRSFPLGRIVWTLKYGVDNMPSYASQIPVNDRWAIAAYVRALQIAQAAPQELRGGK